MFEKTEKGFGRLKPLLASLFAVALVLTAGPNFIQSAHAAPGQGTATISVGTGGTNASDATYVAPGAAGVVTVGTKSYLKIALTVGASHIAANQNNVKVQINPNLFPAATWGVAKQPALTDLNVVGEWHVGYTDTDAGTTNNAAITFNASAATTGGLITIQANQQMDATDIITLTAVVQDNNFKFAAAPIDIKTDDTGGDSLNPIGAPPTIATIAADAAATITLSNPFVAGVGNTTVNMTLPFSLDADDTIDITFPAYMDVSDVDAAVTGTLEGASNITCVAAAQVVTCTTDGATNASGTLILTGITASSHGTIGASLEVEDEGVAANDIATDLDVDMTDIPEGGGQGGGGGGNEDTPNNPDNQQTDDTPENIGLISQDTVLDSPVMVDEANVVNNGDDTVTVKVTDEATLTLKPTQDATVWMMVPKMTSLTVKSTWDRKINPPLVRDETMIDLAGEKIKGSTDLLMRDMVETLVEVQANVPLKFSNLVTLNVPVDLADNTKVKVYTSDMVDTDWVLKGTTTVKDKAITLLTDHPSMFAVVKDEQVTPTPEEEDTPENEDPVPMPEETFVSPFADIKGHWAESYINKLAEMKVVNGKTPTMFDPDGNATRAELTKIAVNAFGLTVNPVVTVKPFDDVEVTDWAAPYIAAAKEAGIVKGVGKNMFAPNQSIDRAQALTIFIRAAKLTDSTAKSTFGDVKDTDWFKGAVMKAAELKIVSGYENGNFGPGDLVTRAQVAKITVETLKNKQ